MAVIRITCPNCGLCKDMAADLIPPAASQVTCPACKQRFPLHAASQHLESPPEPVATAIHPEPPRKTPQPEKPASRLDTIVDQPLEQACTQTKNLLLFFVLLVLLLVGVRLWADGKKRDVHFPNFVATGTTGTAISWGEEVYLLSHDGKVTGTQRLPKGTMLSQLAYVGDELWCADHTTNSIKRLKNDAWETVVNGAKRFRGAFKFVVDQKSGEIFVTDASNHTIHLFTLDGSYIKSFGKEGKNPGELKFPNTILFDRDGNLLVVNTNCHRIDLFSREGAFLKTVAHVEAINNYKFPTLLAKSGDTFAFLHTVDLRDALVMLYSDEGHAIGQLKPPLWLSEAGDIAAWNDSILVTDNKQRKVFLFSAREQKYLGTFSAELEEKGIEASRREAYYSRIAGGALSALLICCLPVFYLYYQTRQREVRNLETIDYRTIIPDATLVTITPDRQKLALAVFTMIIAALFLLWGAPKLMRNPSLMPFMTLANAVFFIIMVRLYIASGYANPSRRDQVIKLARAASTCLSRLLATGEEVEACTALQRNAYLKQASLLVLTSQRILLIDYAAARPTTFRQLGYGDIVQTSLVPMKLGISSLNRFMKTEMFRLTLNLRQPIPLSQLQLTGLGDQVVTQIKQRIDEKYHAAKPLGYALFCPKCFNLLTADGCSFCRKRTKQNWKPLFLSLLYPGLGQFYNREIKKGFILMFGFTNGVIFLTLPLTKILDHSAETSHEMMMQISYLLLIMAVLYIVALADADFVGRQGRKLFSMALFKRRNS